MRPILLCLSGHDPTGGAGIQADIESAAALGARAVTVVAALTVQDTVSVRQFIATPTPLVRAQARALLDDLPIAAVKVGMAGSAANVAAIAALLRERPDLPVVIDPILNAGGGEPLGEPAVAEAMAAQLLPLATLIAPNTPEAARLAGLCDPRGGGDDADGWAATLLRRGCAHALITGTHEATESAEVVNRLYSADGGDAVRPARVWRVRRLPYAIHGSGCTLAAAVAALLARGEGVEQAVDAALKFTWEALRRAVRPGRGQHLPNRPLQGSG